MHREHHPRLGTDFYNKFSAHIAEDAVLRKLMPPPHADPRAPTHLLAFPAYRDAYFVAADLMARTQNHVTPEAAAHYLQDAVLNYPLQDIKSEIESVVRLNEEMSTRDYKSIVSITSVMLEDTTFLDAQAQRVHHCDVNALFGDDGDDFSDDGSLRV